MTAHAIAGLGLFNLLLLVLGMCVFWAVRGWETWYEFCRFAGLAYLLGVAVFGAVWTLLLIVGVGFGLLSIAASVVILGACSVLLGVRIGRPRPRLGRLGPVGFASLVAAVGVAAAGLFLETLFRAGRLQGLFAWDAWSFWVPKAKAIYFYGGLDHQFFTSLPGAPYPPVIPLVDAGAFHFMGGPDTVTFHLQYWFLAVGFVAAVAGILWQRVPPWILWPFLVLGLVAPRISTRLLTPQADFLLDFFFVVAVLLVGIWLRDRSRWLLVAVSLLLCGATLTKREGMLLAACLYLAAGLATCRHWRSAWPPLLASAVVVGLVSLPWRIWYVHNGIGGEAPAGGGVGHSLDVDRALESLRLSVHVLFDTSLWSLIPVITCAAIVLAALWGRASLAVFFGTLCALVTLGGAWITYSFPELPITSNESVNPIVRYTASIVLAAACVAPLLLAGVWPGRPETGAP
jgi:hypothetical protein